MSPAPGSTVTRRETPASRSADTDTGKYLVAGFSERGPTDRVLEVRNLGQFVTLFGVRQTDSPLYDALETYFEEGGARALVSRVVGPAPVTSSLNLLDAASAISLVAAASSPGVWGEELTWEVTHPTGSTFEVIVRRNGTIVERTGEVATTTEAVAAAAAFTYSTLTQGASVLDPAVLAAAPSSNTGTDDRANVTETQYTAARDRFGKDLGPGQVDNLRTTATAHAQSQAHAETNARVAVESAPDTPTLATLTGLAATNRAATGQRSAGLFWPFVQIPPLAGTSQPRVVPASAAVAGVMARNDALGISPNEPAAGDLGQLRYATGLSQPALSEADRQTLNDAGVNVLRVMNGVVTIYGFRTLTNPITDENWIGLANARFYAWLNAQCDRIAETYVLTSITRRRLSDFNGDLVGLLTPLAGPDGPLVGDAQDPPFTVDTGEQVNTDVTIAARQIRAIVGVRPAGMAERVEIEIVKEGVA